MEHRFDNDPHEMLTERNNIAYVKTHCQV